VKKHLLPLSQALVSLDSLRVKTRHRRTRQGVGEGAAALPGLKNFRATASCSKILNNKIYFSTVKNSRATLFFRASASCSKILNDKKTCSNTVKNIRATLFFRESACKLLKYSECKKYIPYSETFLGNSVFQGKRTLLKNLE